MNIVCTIEARMSSSRLPGKVLMKNHERSMLAIMINRIQLAKGIDTIVVATTENQADDVIENEAKLLGVEVFRGSEDNVLERVVAAGKMHNADALVVLTGDCPLIDPILIEECLMKFSENTDKFVSNCLIRSFPDGMDVQVVPMEFMKRVQKQKLTNKQKEHSTLALRNTLDSNQKLNIHAPTELQFPTLGLTLDETSDFWMINSILNHFYPRLNFSCKEIIEYLNVNPEIQEINSKVPRRGDN